jgi:cytidine deaminase
MILDQEILNLIDFARKARNFSRAKYSNFYVGAALQTKIGQIFSGCNIESSSYGLTICAERVALFKALSEGENDFKRIAVVGPVDDFCPPCGACRQVLYDYAPGLEIILTNNNEIKLLSLSDLLPMAFEETKLRFK